VALLLVLALTDGSSDKAKRGHHHKGKHQAHQNGHGGSNGGSSKQPVTLALVTRNDMEVCLVTGDGRALIDAQTLISGANEGPFQPAADNYRLDLDSGGGVTLTLDGKHHTVRSPTPASYNISSDGIQPTSFKGPGCP